jgi:hypothetical protein
LRNPGVPCTVKKTPKTREKEAALLEFCRRQSTHFDERAWVPFAGLSELEVATVASYLAGVAWYGHQEKLCRVPLTLLRTEAAPFPEMAKKVGFEPARFAGLLKARMKHARAS